MPKEADHDASKDAVDGFKAVADFWSAQGKVLLEAQQGAARSIVEGMQAIFGPGAVPPPGPDRAIPPDLARAAEAIEQLWSTATKLSTEMAARFGQPGSGSAAKDMLERITNPKHWMLGDGDVDELLARMVDGPRLADLWDVDRRYGNVMRRWTELQQRSFAHQRVVLDAWMEAGRRYMLQTEGKTLEPKEAMALWTEIGNRHMLETQRSPPFLTSQRDMLRASTELRIAQGELSEFIGKQYGLPTRTEVDELHRSLTEMRRELRKLRRELDAAKPAPPLPEPPPGKSRAAGARPAPTRRKSP